MTTIFTRRTRRHSDLQIRLPWLRPAWAATQKLFASIMGCFALAGWSVIRIGVQMVCQWKLADSQEGKLRAEWSERGDTSNNKSKGSLFRSLIQDLQAKDTNFSLSRVKCSLHSAALYFEGCQIDFFFKIPAGGSRPSLHLLVSKHRIDLVVVMHRSNFFSPCTKSDTSVGVSVDPQYWSDTLLSFSQM